MDIKFEGVDVLDFLGQIVELHTQYYKDDFALDKKLISKLAVSADPEDKRLLWMSRPCGTYTLREREIYLDGSRENTIWKYYQEQTKDPVLAYALSIKGIQSNRVIGNIYPLDYSNHVERIKLLTCPIEKVSVTFKDGTAVTLPYQTSSRLIKELSSTHGASQIIHYEPGNEQELLMILKRERFKRSYHAKPGKVQDYMEKIKKATMRGRLKEAQMDVALPHKGNFNKGGLDR